MQNEPITCLYCQEKNQASEPNCANCGMPLAKKHPESANTRQRFFKKAFYAIVIFCLVMMYYLPR